MNPVSSREPEVFSYKVLSPAESAKVARSLQILLLALISFWGLSLAETWQALPARGRELLIVSRMALLVSLLVLAYRAHPEQGIFWCSLFGLASLVPLALPFAAILAASAGAFQLRRGKQWPGWCAIIRHGSTRDRSSPAQPAADRPDKTEDSA